MLGPNTDLPLMAAQFVHPAAAPSLPMRGTVTPLGPSTPMQWTKPGAPTNSASTVPLPNAMPTSGTATPGVPGNTGHISQMFQSLRQAQTAPGTPSQTATPRPVQAPSHGQAYGQVAPHTSASGLVPYPHLRP